jgi:hypothetical protein
MSLANIAILEHLPGEDVLVGLLQHTLQIRVAGKNIRNGRLVHFKRVHYVFQLVFINGKGNRETLELPLPFGIERYNEESLVYFDYRNKTLSHGNADLLFKISKIRNTNCSVFFDRIVEIEYK